MKTYLRIMAYAKPLGLYLPQFILYTILYSIFSVINLAVLIPLLDVLFNKMPTEMVARPDFAFTIDYFKGLFDYYFVNTAIQSGKFAALEVVCVMIISSVFLSNLFRFLADWISIRVRANIIQNLRNKLFDSLLAMHLGFFTSERKGNIMSKVMNDVLEVESTVVNSLKSVLKDPFLLIAYLVGLMTISFKLTMITLLLLPISGGIISTIAKKLKKKARQSQETLGRLNNILDEVLSGMRIIKAFNARPMVTENFKGEVKSYARFNISMQTKYSLAGPISEFLGVFVITAIVLIGGNMILQGSSSLHASEFIAFIAIFSQILNPAKAISNAFSNIQRGLASGERIFSIIDLVPAIEEKPDAHELESFDKEIRFEKVGFSYEDTPVLKNINLEIPKGKMIALVGPSGGGKSTLADLIPRFYDPKEGSVQIDGVDLKDLTLKSIRGHLGIVTQESILFNDSIFRNIAFGKPNATLEEVMEAAKIANAHDFIAKMEGGYDAIIGERGTKLSGGQRQRISIARAVLKNPEILILDEATSALDSESEKLVQQALANLMKGRTSVVIAHRLSTIQDADEIVVIQEGEIVERGTHQELLKKAGMYSKLIEMQNVG